MPVSCLPTETASTSAETFCPHTPTERQQAFLTLTCQEALYGGAAGGGKSDALLMAALQYVHVPGYAGLLFRRTYADLSLPGALMDRAHEWLQGTGAKWSEREKTWSFPSGATLTFGYLEHENDKYRYQGAEFQFIGFDELTQFSETQYRYMQSRLRRLAGVEIPLRSRGASNPGGVGHDWVKQRFLIEGAAAGRPFVPALLEDNPHLDRESYEESLSQLDHITRAQLRHGNWDVLPEGRLFRREWFEIVETAPAQLRKARWWDMAATEPKPGQDPDWTAGVKVGLSEAGIFYILHAARTRSTPAGVEALILQTAQADGVDTDIWMEQEPGSSGVTVIDHYTREVLRGYAFRGQRSTGQKEVRARPVSSQAEAGNVKLLRGPWNTEFLDEITPFPTPGVHDDQVDALSGAVSALASYGEIESDPDAYAAYRNRT